MPREATELRKLLEPAVTALGFELAGVEFIRAKHGILRVYIDHENGISVTDCKSVSHQLSGVLDVEDPISGNYSLEVSSPGLDRLLFQSKDFERFAGHAVKLQLTVPVDGRRKFVGVLSGIKDDQVVVQMEENEELVVPLNEIERARLIPDYASQRAHGAKGAKKNRVGNE